MHVEGMFDGRGRDAIVASLIELGGRYRLAVNAVAAVQSTEETPNLPVASDVTELRIYAGGAHHTMFSFEMSTDQLYDFADRDWNRMCCN